MGPKEEDNVVFLLSAVTFICGAIVAVPWLFEPAPAEASKAPTYMADSYMANKDAGREPVRVIVPFTPNTQPSQR